MEEEKKGKVIKVEPSYFRLNVDDTPQINVSLVDFNDSLEWLREQVGGCVAHYNLSEYLREYGITCWINDDGKGLQLDPTFALADNKGEVVDYIAGNVIFTGLDSQGETISLDDDQMDAVFNWLYNTALIGVKHYETVNVVMKIGGYGTGGKKYEN